MDALAPFDLKGVPREDDERPRTVQSTCVFEFCVVGPLVTRSVWSLYSRVCWSVSAAVRLYERSDRLHLKLYDSTNVERARATTKVRKFRPRCFGGAVQPTEGRLIIEAPMPRSGAMLLALALVGVAAQPRPPILATTLSATEVVRSASTRENVTYSRGEIWVDVDSGKIRKVRCMYAA